MAAQAVKALLKGEDGDEASEGALLVAEHFAHTKVIADFCLALAKSWGKRR